MHTNNIAEISYVQQGRDLRLDFLRGFVMLMVICIHMEYYSLLSMWLWERIGLISSAEGFVSLSGVVLGIVYKKKMLKEGFQAAALKLLRRAGQLYLVNLCIILSILALRALPGINVYEVTHWSHFLLFTPVGSPWQTVVKQVVLLQIGPHQFQVIGLYALLIAFAPIPLYALYKRQTVWVLLLSWSVFALSTLFHLKLTNARFEYGFSSLAWQVLFFNGMVIGFHHERVFDFLADRKHKSIIYLAAALLGVFMFLALNRPYPVNWPWQPLTVIDPKSFGTIYNLWFRKDSLGFGRILNNVFLFVSFFALLSWHWRACYRLMGWLLIPIGQASLYVFIWHVYFIIFFQNTPLPAYHNFWINTFIHVSTILLIWLMVKRRFMFSIVPR